MTGRKTSTVTLVKVIKTMGILNFTAPAGTFEDETEGGQPWDDVPQTQSTSQPTPQRATTPSRTTATSSPTSTPTRNFTQRMATSTPSNSAPTTRVTTGVIRGSYVKIFKAELPKTAKEGDIPKFGMTLLIPKDDLVTLRKLEAAAQAAINLKWPSKKPARIDTTLHDGDLPRPSNGEPFGDECKGHMVMAVNSKFKPKILDRDGNEILDPAQVGSGDYYKVSVGAYAYDTNGKRGVSFGLNNVLFWERGESLGSMGSAEDDFRDDLPQN